MDKYKFIKLQEGYIIVNWEEQLVKENEYYLSYPDYNTLEDVIQLFDGDYIYTIENRTELSEYIKKKLNKPNEWDIEIEMSYPSKCCINKEGETLQNKECMERNHCKKIKITKVL